MTDCRREALGERDSAREAERRSPLRLGIVAVNFPPDVGGMENHAYGLADALSGFADITVFTARRNAPADYRLPVQNVLAQNASVDIQTLLRFEIDAWLTLNAGYSTLAEHSNRPVFSYCHGTDFLNPFVPQGERLEQLVERLNRVPLLWRASAGRHGTIQHLRRRRIGEGLARASGIFVNSEFTKAALLRQYPRLREGRLRVSNPGVDAHFFTAAPIASRPPAERRDGVRITTIARLHAFARRKNLDGCLRALATIKDRLDFRYTVIGDGDDRPRLEELSAELGLADRVHFTGVVADCDMLAYLDKSDLFLLASISTGSDIEGFGIVYAEAAARGVPSLLSRTGGATDAVRDGLTGIIVAEPTPEHIAAGILRFARERDRFDPAAIRRFAERFRWPHIAGEMWSVIEKGVRS